MGYFSDYKDGLTRPEPHEREAMDEYGLDPDCVEDRARWRWMNADQPGQHRECGHSACSQHYIDTGKSECVKEET